MARLAAGDPEIAADFFVYFENFLSMKLRSRGMPAGLSEDVRQETLFRVLRIVQEGKIEKPERFGAFVNTVCKNVLLEMLRKETHEVELDEKFPEMEGSAILPDDALVTEERKRAVKSILEKLPTKDQEILRLAFFEGLRPKDIATRLGTSSAYVRIVLFRAKARFKAAFEKEFGHGVGV